MTGTDGVSARADIVFASQRVAVFVDGCFWHGCRDHCRIPTSNREYWIAKIGRNQDRDEHVARSLTEADWLVLRIWEHEEVDNAADQVEAALSARSPRF